MIDKLEHSRCTLCKACLNACLQDCISFEIEENTFLYPNIDSDRCIGCCMCEQACPVFSQFKGDISKKNIYAAKILDETKRGLSSSGGVFSALAESIIAQGGVVCGAVYDEESKVRHICTKCYEDIGYFRGSKYVLSEIGYTFQTIKEKLSNKTKVLFSGTPCQIAGLKQYLGQDNDNLLTVDLICHGVPSQITYSKYLKLMERKYHAKVKEINFRDKSHGWNSNSVKIIFNNGKIYNKAWQFDIYMRGFLGNLFLMDACYDCQFKSLTSGSDITLGDYWGAEIINPDIDDNKGLSLVILNTNSGCKMLRLVKKSLFMKQLDFEKSTTYNQYLFKSAIPNKNRKQFLQLTSEQDYYNAFNKYCKAEMISTYIRKGRSFLGKLKRKIKG